ncbi:MAG TPA: ABC transporter ATP-binding protein [Spirochaetia bacterium]|nr:ABC transporter ATP-binding protein [Spirochaetia bacterium]
MEKAKNIRGALLRIWGYLRQQRAALLVVVLLVVGTTSVTVVTPYFFGVAIDRYIVPGDFRGLLGLVVLVCGLYAAQAVGLWLQSWVMASLAQDTVRAMRRELFHSLLALPVRFFDRTTRGELMSRLANDAENVNVTLNQGLTLILSSALTLVGTLAMMIALSPMLTLLSLVVLPASLLITRAVARAARESFREQQESLGDLNGHIEETISGRRVVQAFGRERHTLETFDRHNLRLRSSGTRALIVSGNMGPYMNLVNNIGFAVVAAGGGYLALRHLATAGLIAAFISYARQFSRPVNEIANQYSQIQSAVAGAERVFDIMDQPPEPADAPQARALTRVEGRVRFSSVHFGYDANRPVLTDVSLEATPGRTIALVGPTGAGKTTIVNLLTRFYDIDSGTISLDGQDIRLLPRDGLRSALGIVLQDTHLFSETVRENIRYGRLSATDAEVVEAARTANAESFILRLHNGYDTVLSEEGGSLSQGQRQLLSIARAILADPAVLILDEATSSVDTRTELHIQQAMLRLMRGRTSFVIAHRLSTIRDADEILVINGGRIIERGTHPELLERKGFYWRLYSTQFDRTGNAGA